MFITPPWVSWDRSMPYVFRPLAVGGCERQAFRQRYAVAYESTVPPASVRQLERFTQVEHDIRVGCAQCDWNRRQRVPDRPGVDLRVRPLRGPGDDRIVIAGGQFSGHRHPPSAQKQVDFDQIDGPIDQGGTLCEILAAASPGLVGGRENLDYRYQVHLGKARDLDPALTKLHFAHGERNGNWLDRRNAQLLSRPGKSRYGRVGVSSDQDVGNAMATRSLFADQCHPRLDLGHIIVG